MDWALAYVRACLTRSWYSGCCAAAYRREGLVVASVGLYCPMAGVEIERER